MQVPEHVKQPSRPFARLLAGAAVAGALLLQGCHQDMWNQPRYTAHQKSEWFADSSAARQPAPGTVTYIGKRRDWAAEVYMALTGEEKTPPVTEEVFWTGKVGNQYLENNYFPVAAELLERGRERYNVYCLPCHSPVGDGQGIIKQRGFPQPASYHIDRLREVEDGYLFDVMTNGFGRMYSYAARVLPEDRWAIAAYIRALQYSQNARLEDLTAEERDRARNPLPEPEEDFEHPVDIDEQH